MTFHEGLRTMITLAPDEGTAPSAGLSSLAANVPYRLLRHPSLKIEDVETVFCWLFCSSYDVLDIAETLSKRTFSGTLIAQTWDLPNPKIVKAELRRSYPMLSFDIEFMPETHSGNEKYERFMRQRATVTIA